MCKNIEKMFRNFLWKGADSNKECHLVNWDKVKFPCSLEGLGVEDPCANNFSFLTKCCGVLNMKKMLCGGKL